jgi:DNA-binding NarL/FixJ family response regulator
MGGTAAARGQAELMLEREAEVERLEVLINDLAEGRHGVVAVEAVAGLGKTTLLRHTQRLASDARLQVLSARASELERDYAFGVVKQWLEPLLLSASEAERQRLLSGAAGLAAPVLLEPPRERQPAEVSHRVLHGLYWLLSAVAESGPVLLLVDDAQWADDASLRLLNFVLARLEGVPIAVLVACRPVEVHESGMLLARLLADPACVQLRLAPLGDEAAGALLADQFGRQPEARFLTAAQQAAGGNPFYLREVGALLAADGAAPTDDQAPRVTQLRPRNVARAILARLSPGARSLAQALAVLDKPAELRLASAVSGLGQETAGAAVGELRAAGVVDDAGLVGFVHPIVQGAVLDSLSAAERSDLHARAVRELEARGAGAERIAIHLLELEPQGDKSAIRVLADGAGLAMSRGAPEVAVRLLRRALSEGPDPATEVELLLELGLAENESDLPEAAAHLWRAAELSENPVLRARAGVAASWAMGGVSSPDVAAVSRIDEAIAELGDQDRELSLALEASALMVLFLSPHGREAMAERAARFVDLDGTTPGEAVILAGLARFEMDSGAPADRVASFAERAIACPETLQHQGAGSSWLLNCAIALIQTERLDVAQNLLEAAVEHARELGSATGFAIASANLAGVALRRGDLRPAEADARAALDSGGARGWYRAGATTRLIEALVRQGRLEEAEAAYDATGFGEQIPEARPATPLLIARGQLRWAQGNVERAAADLTAALHRISRHAAPTAVGLDARLLLVLAQHAAGDVDRARAEAHEALAITREWGAPGAIGDSLRVSGLVVGGSEGVELLQQAVETLSASQHRLTYATALIDLGAALRRQGQRAAARDPLREGLALADWAGAAPLQERARRELRATGVRVPRAGARDRLTPSEQRIAEMAAAGSTNPQIAQALFVTVKTVESHLAGTYRKLDINSRRELPGALAKQDERRLAGSEPALDS